MWSRGIATFFMAAFILNVVYVLLSPELPHVLDPHHPSCPEWVAIAIQAGILSVSALLGVVGAKACVTGKGRQKGGRV